MLWPDAVYATLGDVYALESSSGQILRRYSFEGIAEATIVADRLYLNVSNHPDYVVRCLRVPDGASLWSYAVGERLAGAPAVARGMVYVTTVEGTIYVLQASDGALVWSQRIEAPVGSLSFLGSFFSVTPTVAGGRLYVSLVVNQPLQPFVYAFDASNGSLLLKVNKNQHQMAITLTEKDFLVKSQKS
ncbi:MAG: PQQ-binding-like beta-propeller repeat protein [Ktedonobacteraceae bacterium]|nr:PQQ-binding-like beta-propeller repeat protein [Ktedonobacteraceae bacterium]